MMDWREISSQADLDRLIGDFNWHEAVIREMHVASDTYSIRTDEGQVGTYNHGALPTIRFFITAIESGIAAIDLHFIEAKNLSVSFAHDLSPRALWRADRIEWWFSSHVGEVIEVTKAKYRVLDESIWGDKRLYSEE